jgi:hypothetical protein
VQGTQGSFDSILEGLLARTACSALTCSALKSRVMSLRVTCRVTTSTLELKITTDTRCIEESNATTNRMNGGLLATA